MNQFILSMLIISSILTDDDKGYHLTQRSLAETRQLAIADSSLHSKYLNPIMVKIQGGEYLNSPTPDTAKTVTPHPKRMYTYYIGKYEVTVEEYALFVKETGYITDAEMLGTNNIYSLATNFLMPRHSIAGINWRHNELGEIRPTSEYHHPVIHVSWNDAIAYCKWISTKTQKQYRLPTEQEWEYAAGNRSDHTRYSWGNDTSLVNRANLADQSLMEQVAANKSSRFYRSNDNYVYSSPVGAFLASKTKLHDMTGNVWEWCMDRHPNNPDPEPIFRMIRGGSWNTGPEYSAIATQGNCRQNHSEFDLGFRLVMVP